MPTGKNFTNPAAEADLTAARTALQNLQTKLAFVPRLPQELITSATMTPERLPLADLALQAADQDPDVMRKSCDPEQLRTRLAAYRGLHALRNQLEPELKRLDNALNVLGSDILFHVNNIHEDIEKDKGESTTLGELRQQINAYYARPGARKAAKAKPA